MNAASVIAYRSKAKVPFADQLAREFGLEQSHVWRVCVGERASPLRDQMLDRQKELVNAAKQSTTANQPAHTATTPQRS